MACLHDRCNAMICLLPSHTLGRQVGHPDYEVTAGSASFKGGDLLELDPEDRARAGLFMSFQSPVEVPGVSNIDFLRAASNACRKRRGEAELVRSQSQGSQRRVRLCKPNCMLGQIVHR